MGYCVSISVSEVIIPANKVEDAIKAIKEAKVGENIEDAGSYAGHEIYRHDNGDVEIGDFIGEKWRSQEDVYTAIAPYVKDNGTIECLGQDGEKWRYIYKDGKCNEQHAVTSWE